jgi:hypothetical protein
MQESKPVDIHHTKDYNCPRCGELNLPAAIVCSACGSRLPWADKPLNAASNSKLTQSVSSASSKVKFLPAEQLWWQRINWGVGLAATLGITVVCLVVWGALTTNGSGFRFLAGIVGIPLLFLGRFAVRFLVRSIVDWLFD